MEVLTGRPQPHGWVRLIVLLSLFAGSLAAFEAAAIGQQNPIQAENARPGTTDWQLQNPSGDNEGSQIEGYASATSVNRGANISFFVRTTGTSYTIAIYRLGWYGGLGGRLEVAPKSFPAISQPLPTPDPTYRQDRMQLDLAVHADDFQSFRSDRLGKRHLRRQAYRPHPHLTVTSFL